MTLHWIECGGTLTGTWCLSSFFMGGLKQLASLSIRAQPYQDAEELLLLCYRCSMTNPLYNPRGNCCIHCGEAFIFSFISFGGWRSTLFYAWMMFHIDCCDMRRSAASCRVQLEGGHRHRRSAPAHQNAAAGRRGHQPQGSASQGFRAVWTPAAEPVVAGSVRCLLGLAANSWQECHHCPRPRCLDAPQTDRSHRMPATRAFAQSLLPQLHAGGGVEALQTLQQGNSTIFIRIISIMILSIFRAEKENEKKKIN